MIKLKISSLIMCLLLMIGNATFAQQPVLPYLNPDLPMDQRVDDLIGRMTCVVVVPLLIKTISPSSINDEAKAPILCFSSGCFFALCWYSGSRVIL